MTPYETAFYETLYALDNEHLKNLIVVGGWCPYLYAKHVWRRQAPEIMTMDIDFAVRTMSPDRFSEPVYKKLLASNLIPRRMDMDDDNRFQFAYLAGKSLVPIEFITSPTVLPKGQVSLPTPYVASFKTRPDVKEAGNILREFIGDETKKGYGMLREYFERWGIPRDRMNEQINETFAPLLAVLAKKGRG